MELTTQQLQRVEHYLNVKDITYIDIRTEVFDHIVSDIETKIETEKLDFETVFYNVTDKWNIHLKQTSSWLYGIAYSAPKIVMKKVNNNFRKWFLISNSLMILLSMAEKELNLSFSKNTQVFLTNSLVIINIISSFILVFLMTKNSKIKEKTSYSFILKTQSLGFFLGFVAIFFSGIIEGVTPIYSLTLTYIAVTYIYSHFLKKHKEAIKKYKIL
ncbi:hypothetical protein BTO15_06245 [Polaribacter sejongensis]|uniref:Uncharacterized protein n=1 Tax=Polaribacter sejongensis TaxID=985043 RepID=A0ABM6PYD0_9FLAO|nr:MULTISPECIES: hypothetical protein [Polaribacter]AUC21731.1 hypothetical protein BTO15_06245 [Polaribacter sejongensis]